MSNLSGIIRYAYPAAVPYENYLVRNDGRGDYIAFWDTKTLGPQPTEQSILDQEAAWQAWVNAGGRVKAKAKQLYQKTEANETLVRALALTVLDEINILRAAAKLQPRTPAQLKTAIQNKIDAE